MCKKLPYCNPRIDSCIVEKVKAINEKGFKTVSSCCGHGKYDTTIVIENPDGTYTEWYSCIILSNAKRYKGKVDRVKVYQKEKYGKYYYLPELIKIL